MKNSGSKYLANQLEYRSRKTIFLVGRFVNVEFFILNTVDTPNPTQTGLLIIAIKSK